MPGGDDAATPPHPIMADQKKSDAQTDTEIQVSDAAKALAEKHKIDLATVNGTGKDGFIKKDDIASLVQTETEKEEPKSSAAASKELKVVKGRSVQVPRYADDGTTVLGSDLVKSGEEKKYDLEGRLRKPAIERLIQKGYLERV